MAAPRFTLKIPPQIEEIARRALFEIGAAGAKAAAAGARSLVTDVRKKVKEIDQRLAHAEKVAKERAKDDDEV